MKNKILISLLIFVSVFTVTSCKEKKEEVIELDKTYPLALAPDVSWAVVTDPYVAFREDMNWNAEIEGHCRKGDILQVIGSAKDKENQIWYKFENGWLADTSVVIYSNRYKAKVVSDQLKDK